MIKSKLVLMARTPSQGPAKTRLAKTLGREIAETFHEESFQSMLRMALNFAHIHEHELILYLTAPAPHFCRGLKCFIQDNKLSLGEKIQGLESRINGKMLLFGSDTPELSATHLRSAIAALENGKSVIGPCSDGGFYLYGSSKKLEQWVDIPMSSSKTCSALESLLHEKGHPYLKLQELNDIDHAEDLITFRNKLLRSPSSLNKQYKKTLELSEGLEEDVWQHSLP